MQFTWGNFLHNCSFDFSQKSRKQLINFLKKSLVRLNSKSQICQRSQPISYMANSPWRDNIYQLGHICIITYKNIRGKVRSDIKLGFNHNWRKINRKMTYAMYIRNSIVPSSLKTEKIISSFFDIIYLFRYHLFGCLYFFISL